MLKLTFLSRNDEMKPV